MKQLLQCFFVLVSRYSAVCKNAILATLKDGAAFFLLLLLSIPISAQTFWTETFGTSAAFSSWTAFNTGGGTEQWKRSTVTDANMGFNTAPKPFASPTAANGFAFFNSDANGQVVHDVTLTSPVINCASQASVGIRFHSQFAQDGLSEASVRVSSDGGATWTSYPVLVNQPSYGLGQSAFVPTDILSEILLPAANNKAAVIIQFRWVGEYEYGWKLDDIELYNYSAPKADITFKVNMTLQTVSGGGVRVTGSFNGWTDELMTNEGGGIWSITKSLSVGETIQYKFKNGSGGGESGQSTCGVNDGNGGYNRQFVVKGPITIPLVCFNTCKDCVIPCSANLPANKLVCDNFDSYVTTMKLAKQSPTNWTTWTGIAGTAEDGIVTTEQAASIPNSMKIISIVATGGPQDAILKLANKNTGRYSLKWKMYIPIGKGAYYNIQNEVPIPATPVWNLDVHFTDSTNTGHGDVTQVKKIGFTYPHGQWFTVEHIVDLDNNVLTYSVNDKIAGKIAFTGKLGGIDFFGENATNTYYVDDVEYVVLPPAPAANADACETAVDLSIYFGQAVGVTQTTPSYDNTNATASLYDPTVDCTSEDKGSDFSDNTLWFTFIGDGNRYTIETDSCSAKFITYGDTEIALFEGPDCFNLTFIACNDDIDVAIGNYRSFLDFDTEAGKVYYILMDGYLYPDGSTKGEFCFKITQKASITCAEGAVGTFEVANSGLVCNGSTLSDLITTNDASFIIPNEGPVSGLTWAITTDPVPAGILPSGMTGKYWGSFAVLSSIYAPALVNNNVPLTYGVWYFTPVVVAGAVDTVISTAPNYLHELDFTKGCYFVGQSVPFELLPTLEGITATSVVTKETVPPGNNGKIDLMPTGGWPNLITDPSLYIVKWSNGATTEDISGLAAASYTTTITDPSGCVSPFSTTIIVEATTTNCIPPSVTISGAEPICPGGSIILTASGGSTYKWAGPSSFTSSIPSPTITTPGIYTVEVTDSNGCTGTATAIITAAPPLNVTISGIKSFCQGGSTILTASGGDDYDWIGPGGFTFNGSSPMVKVGGIYTVSATNTAGCVGIGTVTVTQHSPSTALLSSNDTDNTICPGDPVTFTASGGERYLFSLNGVLQQGDFSAINTYTPPALANGAVISVRIKDSNMCQDSTRTGEGPGREPITMTVLPSPNLSGWALTRLPGCPEDPVLIRMTAPNLPNGVYQFDWKLDNQSAQSRQQNFIGGMSTLSAGVLPAGIHLARVSNIKLNNAVCSTTPSSGSSVSFDVKPLIATLIDTTVCLGKPVKVGTQTFTQSGNYTIPLQSAAGCDSTVTLKIQAATEIKVERTAQFCADGFYNFYGQMLNQGGSYQKKVPGPNGCDSTITLHLSAASVTFGYETRSICPGKTYTLIDGTVVKDAGVYVAKTKSTAGCDSTIQVTLKIKPIAVSFNAADLRICKNDTVQLNAMAQNCTDCYYTWSTGAITNQSSIPAPQTTTTATYSVTVQDNEMCTASATVLLTVVEPYFIELDTQLCPGKSLEWDGEIITEEVDRVHNYKSKEGCDSTVTLRVKLLTFNPLDFQVARDTTMTMPANELSWAFDVSHKDNYPTNYWHVVLDPPLKGKVEVQNDQKLLYTPDPGKRSGLDSIRFSLCPPANCPDACDEAVLTIDLDGDKKMPNMIVPESNGLNAYFNPIAYMRDVEKVKPDTEPKPVFVIYNRWGEVLHKFSEYPENGWDGKDSKGHVLPQATYYYTLQYQYLGKPYQRRGAVNLLKK